MEYKPLPIGIDNFEKLVTRGYYFADKTLFVKELLDKRLLSGVRYGQVYRKTASRINPVVNYD